jgi:hypothetical protein
MGEWIISVILAVPVEAIRPADGRKLPWEILASTEILGQGGVTDPNSQVFCNSLFAPPALGTTGIVKGNAGRNSDPRRPTPSALNHLIR